VKNNENAELWVFMMIADDFATLYISNDLDENYKIIRPIIYNEIVKYIQSRGVKVNSIEGMNKHGRKYRVSFIDSQADRDLYWRIKIIPERSGIYKRLYLEFSPEFKIRKILSQEEVAYVALKDIGYIRDKIGHEIKVHVGGAIIQFMGFSYSQESQISIDRWSINFDRDNMITYKDFIDKPSSILQFLRNRKTFEFRIINLTKRGLNDNIIGNIVSLLEKYGNYQDLYYDRSDYKSINTLKNASNVINIIFIDRKNDPNFKRNYYESRKFFLENNIPFQHIDISGKISNNSYAQDMMVMEIYKKIHAQDFYLTPDHFNREPIAGFIYIDTDSLYDPSNHSYADYLIVSYVFSQNLNYFEEKMLRIDNVKVYAKRDYFNIFDVDKAADSIISGNEVVRKYSNSGSYFNIIVTRQLNHKSTLSLVDVLDKRGIKINRVYYVSNHRLRFVDNKNYCDSNHDEHYYKIIGKNMAVIKIATGSFLFPQLFSTFVKISYPLDAQITINDLKNVIWLSKKRIYRAYSLKNVTLLEPVIIKRKNKEFIQDIGNPINLNLLI